MVGHTAKQSISAGKADLVRCTAVLLTFSALCGVAGAQVFVVQREKLSAKDASLTTVQPTSVALDSKPITERTRQQLIRTFQADEAFAVRPLPLGTRGVTLHANGPLSPSGTAFADELEKYGISASRATAW